MYIVQNEEKELHMLRFPYWHIIHIYTQYLTVCITFMYYVYLNTLQGIHKVVSAAYHVVLLVFGPQHLGHVFEVVPVGSLHTGGREGHGCMGISTRNDSVCVCVCVCVCELCA